MDYDNIIDKIFWKDSKLMQASKRKRKLATHQNVLEYILNRYEYVENPKEALFRIHYHIDNRPVCAYCGKPAKFAGRMKLFYQTYCSNSCAGKGTERGKNWYENQKKANIDKYGVSCNFFIPTNDWKKTREKIKKTCLEKYGCTSNLGVKGLERGNYFASPEFKLRKIELQEKAKQTCLKRYGVDNYIKTKEFKDRVADTKRKNGTFNSSKPEEDLYLYIKEKFPLVERQYKDKERYPYNCDFYIPELDLFLELQGTWTHGKHAYNPDSIEDVAILQEWKSMNTKYYDNAIKTWTISDVKKRSTAKQNNLNFKEVWSLKEGTRFIDGLRQDNK